MSIRCNELNVPAAIGCGEKIFDKIVLHKTVQLNCENKTYKPNLKNEKNKNISLVPSYMKNIIIK